MKEFDVIVIGAGSAGLAAAKSAAGQGAQVGVIESGCPGGHSLYKGIFPLQSLAESASDSISIERLVQLTKDYSENTSRDIIESLKSDGVEWFSGVGMMGTGRQVMVRQDEETLALKTGSVVIATGSSSRPLPAIPFDDESIFPIDRLLDWPQLPESLLVVDGDKAGLEAAHLFSQLGVKVFLVETRDRLIHDQGSDLIAALEKGFKQQKIKVLTGKKIISLFKQEGTINVTLDGGVKFSVEKILVSGERLGNTDTLELEPLGIRTGEHQEIWVNEQMETSLKGVFAAGSVTGRSRSREISEEEGRVAGLNAAGAKECLESDHIPFVLQTHPAIASIGCQSSNAHYKGYRAVEGRCDASSSANSGLVDDSFCKVVVDRESKRIIGAQISGDLSARCIALVQSKIREGATLKEMTCFEGDSSSFFAPLITAAKACKRALSARR